MNAEEAKKFIADRENTVNLKYVCMGADPKYLRMDKEYRFCDFRDEHVSLVQGKVSSAGFVNIRPRGLQVEGYSMTLNIGPAVNDEYNISELLGIPQNREHGSIRMGY